ncbi:MAG: hypothetical protein Q4G69_12255 [Planctomycetia bacterium]|nr:hypothetical protein [Planctomycetia bacterium]
MKGLEKLADDFFEEAEIKFECIEGTRYIYVSSFDSKTGSVKAFLDVKNDSEIIRIVAIHDQKIPEDFRDEVARFFIKVNYNIIIGSLQIDLSDGEVRYVNTIDTEDIEYTVPALKRAYFLPLIMLGRYMPAVMRIVYANFTADQALEFVNAEIQASQAPEEPEEEHFDTGSGYVDPDTDDEGRFDVNDENDPGNF